MTNHLTDSTKQKIEIAKKNIMEKQKQDPLLEKMAKLNQARDADKKPGSNSYYSQGKSPYKKNKSRGCLSFAFTLFQKEPKPEVQTVSPSAKKPASHR